MALHIAPVDALGAVDSDYGLYGSSEISSDKSVDPYSSEEQLASLCSTRHWAAPSYQIYSDRRGGRTAWSSVVNVNELSYPARQWYSGDHVASARKDAAAVALRSIFKVTVKSGYEVTRPWTASIAPERDKCERIFPSNDPSHNYLQPQAQPPSPSPSPSPAPANLYDQARIAIPPPPAAVQRRSKSPRQSPVEAAPRRPLTYEEALDGLVRTPRGTQPASRRPRARPSIVGEQPGVGPTSDDTPNLSQAEFDRSVLRTRYQMHPGDNMVLIEPDSTHIHRDTVGGSFTRGIKSRSNMKLILEGNELEIIGDADGMPVAVSTSNKGKPQLSLQTLGNSYKSHREKIYHTDLVDMGTHSSWRWSQQTRSSKIDRAPAEGSWERSYDRLNKLHDPHIPSPLASHSAYSIEMPLPPATRKSRARSSSTSRARPVSVPVPYSSVWAPVPHREGHPMDQELLHTEGRSGPFLEERHTIKPAHIGPPSGRYSTVRNTVAPTGIDDQGKPRTRESLLSMRPASYLESNDIPPSPTELYTSSHSMSAFYQRVQADQRYHTPLQPIQLGPENTVREHQRPRSSSWSAGFGSKEALPHSLSSSAPADRPGSHSASGRDHRSLQSISSQSQSGISVLRAQETPSFGLDGIIVNWCSTAYPFSGQDAWDDCNVDQTNPWLAQPAWPPPALLSRHSSPNSLSPSSVLARSRAGSSTASSQLSTSSRSSSSRGSVSSTWRVSTLTRDSSLSRESVVTDREERRLSSAKKAPVFQCNLCPKRFTRAYNLRAHMRAHDMTCSICGISFSGRDELTSHRESHADGKRYVCKGVCSDGAFWGCGSRFARAESLGRHLISMAGRVCIQALVKDQVSSAPSRGQLSTHWWEMLSSTDYSVQGLCDIAPDILSSAWTPLAYPTDRPAQGVTLFLPATLLAQYPALADFDWSENHFVTLSMNDATTNQPRNMMTRAGDDSAAGTSPEYKTDVLRLGAGNRDITAIESTTASFASLTEVAASVVKDHPRAASEYLATQRNRREHGGHYTPTRGQSAERDSRHDDIVDERPQKEPAPQTLPTFAEHPTPPANTIVSVITDVITEAKHPLQLPSFSQGAKLARKAQNMINRLLERRPNCGKKRVEWTCPCGKRIYDDYVELKPGSLDLLKQQLDSITYAHSGGNNATGVTAETLGAQKLGVNAEAETKGHESISRNSMVVRDHSSHDSSDNRINTSDNPPHQATQESPTTDPAQKQYSPSPSSAPTGTSTTSDTGHGELAHTKVTCDDGTRDREKPMHLILGSPFSTLATRVEQPDMSNIASDREFFLSLKAHYTSLRGNLFRRLFSFRALVDMRFVKIELLSQSLAQVRAEDDIPPEHLCRSASGTNSVDDAYTYNPAPAEFVPPIGQRTIMHFLEHPQVANASASVLFERVPRKLHRRLQVCPSKGYSIGWGLQYVEGISHARVFLVGLACCILSTIVGIAYSVRKDDVQGGFAIAAYMMMLLVFLLGSTQALLDR